MSQKHQVRISRSTYHILKILSGRLGVTLGEVVAYLADHAVGEWPPVDDADQAEIDFQRCAAHLMKVETLWPEGCRLKTWSDAVTLIAENDEELIGPFQIPTVLADEVDG